MYTLYEREPADPVNRADRQVPFPVDDGAGRAGVRLLVGRARAAGLRAVDFLGAAFAPVAGLLARLRRAGVGMKALISAEGNVDVRLRGTVLLSAPWRPAYRHPALGFRAAPCTAFTAGDVTKR